MKNNQQGFSLLEIMIAVGLMGGMALVGIQITKMTKKVENQVVVKSDKLIGINLVRDIIQSDLKRSEPSFLFLGNSTTDPFYVDPNVTNTASKDLFDVKWNNFSDKEFILYLTSTLKAKFEHPTNMTIFFPTYAYTTSGNSVRYSASTFASVLRKRYFSFAGKDYGGPAFFSLRATTNLRGKPYAALLYMNSGTGISVINQTVSISNTDCIGSSSYSNSVDKFLRCLPDGGGNNYFILEPVEIYKYSVKANVKANKVLDAEKADNTEKAKRFRLNLYRTKASGYSNGLVFDNTALLLSDEVKTIKITRPNVSKAQVKAKVTSVNR